MPTAFRVIDVFTPNSQARINFVERPDLENHVVDSLGTPGKQVVVYGHSGSGKSSLLSRKLEQVYENHITTRCQAATTFDQMLLNAFDQLDLFYADTSSFSESSSSSTGIETQFAAVRTSLARSTDRGSTENKRRVIPPQLTAQRLAQFMGAKDLCWVLEDFHKIDPGEKLHLAQSLKVFCDESVDFERVRVILIGAAGTARQVIECDREMRNRVAEIEVPLMSSKELFAILENGEQFLNIEIPSWIKAEIVRYSSGLGSVCHQFALSMCQVHEIARTCDEVVKLTEDDFKKAQDRYIRQHSDTLKSVFDRALRRIRVRKYDNTRLILCALANGPSDGMTVNEILTKVREDASSYPQGNLTTYLGELQSEDRGEVVRLDSNSGRYAFSDPLYHVFAKMLLASATLPSAGPGADELSSILATKLTAIADTWLNEWKRGKTGPSDS